MCLAQEISTPSVVPSKRDRFHKTTAFFDWFSYVFERTKGLASEAKDLVVALLVLILLIEHCIRVLGN